MLTAQLLRLNAAGGAAAMQPDKTMATAEGGRFSSLKEDEDAVGAVAGTRLSPSDEASSARERALTSFASLLSSALTVEGDLPEPLAGSSSALSCFLSPRSVGPSDVCASFPGLDLKAGKGGGGAGGAPPVAAATAGMGLEESAAFSLAVPVLCRRDDLVDVPRRVLANVAASFVQLIDARMRSSLNALLRKTLQRGAMAGFGGGAAGVLAMGGGGAVGSDAHTKMVIGLLSSDNPVAPTTVVTSFRVLPGMGTDPAADGEGDTDAPRLILPLVFEAVVDLSVLGTAITVPIRAPGTVKGTFDDCGSSSSPGQGSNGDGLLRAVEVTLDTLALLRAMMKQARFAVRKAVAAASGIASTLVTATGTLPGATGGKTTSSGVLNLLGQNLGAGTHRKFAPRRLSNEKDKDVRSRPPNSSSAAGESSSSWSSAASRQLSSFSSTSRSSSSVDSSPPSASQKGAAAKAKVKVAFPEQQHFDMPPPPPRKPLRGCYSSPGLRSAGLASALSSQPRYSSSSKSGGYRPVMPLGPLRPTATSGGAGRTTSQEFRNVRFKDLSMSDDGPGGSEGGNKNAEWGAPPTAAAASTVARVGGGSSAARPGVGRLCLDSAAAAQGLAMLGKAPSIARLKKRMRHSEAGASLAAAAAAAAAALDDDEGVKSSSGPLRKRRVVSSPAFV